MSAPRDMGRADAPLPEAADLIIVGGGVMGLATAFELSRRAPSLRVCVLEATYLVSGASGRNGGGVRSQWGDAGNVAIMRESLSICRGLAQELGINLWFRRGGYLFLARDEETQGRLERNLEVHREVGAPTRMLSAAQAKRLVPELDVRQVRCATYNAEDGVVFPWPFVWGYAARAVEQGVTVRTHTRVTGIRPQVHAGEDGFALALSTGETIWGARVLNATGAWSPQLNAMLGVELPNRPHRHEIISTEPLKPFLDPLVVDLVSGLYFSQSTRGEIVTGVTLHDVPGVDDDGVDLGTSLHFMETMAHHLTAVLPLARALHPVRQWSGPYDISPDGDAIVGASPDHPGFVQCCGFTGHGFMMAPAVGRLLAAWLHDGTSHPMMDRWRPDRFARGLSRRHEDMIIG